MSVSEPLRFFEAEDISAMLGIPLEEFSTLVKSRVLLELKLSDGTSCYPAFQFPGDELNGELIALFQQFPESWTGWEITSWFHRHNSYLNTTPAEHIHSHCNTSQLRLVVDFETTLHELA